MKVGVLTVTLLLAAVLPRAGLSDAAHRTVEMTPIAAEGELAKELGRYGMTAWRTVNRGPKFSCLAYTPPNAGRKPIPLVVYIPGRAHGDRPPFARRTGGFPQVAQVAVNDFFQILKIS